MKAIVQIALASVIAAVGVWTIHVRQVNAEQGAPDDKLPVVGWLRDGSATYSDATPPIEWSSKTNVLWKLSVGGGYSSPIVARNSVIVTAEPNVVVCVDIATGKEQWKTSTPVTELPKEQQALVLPSPGEGGNMAGTAVCDGERVYAVFAVGFAVAFDLKTGKRLWTHAFAAPLPGDGRSGSPVRVAELLVVHLSQVVALDTKTGLVKWEQDEREAYGTMLPSKIGNDDVLFMPRGDVIRAVDGKILANLDGALQYCSPCATDKKVFYIDSNFYIFDLPEKLTNPLNLPVYWSDSIDGEYYATPLIWNGFVYTLNKTGLLTVLDVKNKKKTDKQLELDGVCYPSPVLAGKFIYVGDASGKTIVLEAGKELKIVKTNKLDEGSGGTPAFAGNKMFIRSGDELLCIGEK